MADHGTYQRYAGHPGCRCDDCKAAKREYTRVHRAYVLKRGLVDDRGLHGTHQGWDAGCRCEACCEHHRARGKAYYVDHPYRPVPEKVKRERRAEVNAKRRRETETRWEVRLADPSDYCHGKYTTYNERGCRCVRCREAWRVYYREWRQRTLAKLEARRG